MDNQSDSEITHLNWLDKDIRKYIQSIYRVQHFYSNLTDIDKCSSITKSAKTPAIQKRARYYFMINKKKRMSFRFP
jgi:hypothetical protein